MDFNNIKSVSIPEGNAVQIYDGSHVIFEPNPITGVSPLNFCAEGNPLVGYSIAGKTVQNGTPTPTSPIDIQGVGDRTANLFEEIIENANISATGAILYTADYDLVIARVTEGETYTNSGTEKLCGYYSSKPELGSTALDLEWHLGVVTFTPPSGTKWVAFRQARGGTTAMLNAGSTARPYEPYGYKVTTTNRGKNLFDKANVAHGWFGNASTEFTASSTDRITVYAKCEPNTTYTIQKLKTSRFVIATSSVPPTNGASINTNYGSAQGTAGTITTGEHDNYMWAWIYLRADDTQIDMQELLDSVMIHSGSTILPYEPYRDPITTTLYTDKPLYGTGTSLDYLQRLADGTGVEHREWGAYRFTGNENAEFRKLDSVYRYAVRITSAIHAPQSICSHFGWSTTSGGTQNHFYISDTHYIYLFHRDSTTIEDFKSYLAAQYAAGAPVTVIYPLATPTETPVTLPAIGTAKGTNVLDTNTTVKPSQVSVKTR